MAETEKQPAQSFEKGLEELEKVVEQLEDGELPLEQALERFERGVELSEVCRQQLEAAETKVEILLKKNDKLTAKPFETEDR